MHRVGSRCTIPSNDVKAEFALPLVTNLWQNYPDEDTDKSYPIVVGGGGQPGDYPSGLAVRLRGGQSG